MKFEITILLKVCITFSNWRDYPQIAMVVSSYQGLDINCMGSFISQEHVITIGDCIKDTLKVKTYKTGFYPKDEAISFYKVKKIDYIKKPPLINSNS